MMVQSVLHHLIALHDAAVHSAVENSAADNFRCEQADVHIFHNDLLYVHIDIGFVEKQRDQSQLGD